jgi:hypothetical protein
MTVQFHFHSRFPPTTLAHRDGQGRDDMGFKYEGLLVVTPPPYLLAPLSVGGVIVRQARLFVALGYEYLDLDDCWAASARDNATGELVVDVRAFPDGIKSATNAARQITAASMKSEARDHIVTGTGSPNGGSAKQPGSKWRTVRQVVAG